MVDDEAQDPLASVIIGINRAGANTLNSALHPVDTGKAILQALRSPKKAAKAVASQIKADFKEDPIRTLTENFFPMPSPAGKLRKIVVPEKLALPHELEALRRAKDNKINFPTDRVERQEAFQKNYEGWYPGEDGTFRKDIGEVDINPAAFASKGKSQFELVDILRHPDLAQRLLQTGRPLPKFVRKPKHDRSGAYWDGKIMGQTWGDGRPEVKVGETTPERFRDLFNHEVQHAAQDYGDLNDPYRGAGQAEGLERYWSNPGEVEARVAALRSEMTPAERKLISFPAMVELERNITHTTLKNGMVEGGFGGGTRWEHSMKLLAPQDLADIEADILKDIEF
jgi:hypothetical protein